MVKTFLIFASLIIIKTKIMYRIMYMSGKWMGTLCENEDFQSICDDKWSDNSDRDAIDQFLNEDTPVLLVSEYGLQDLPFDVEIV